MALALLSWACSPSNDLTLDNAGAAVDSLGVAASIEAMLRSSAESWNAGDLEGFLDDYTDDPTLTFLGSSGVQHGKTQVRQRYLDTYWSPGQARDSLRFEDIEVRALGTDYALAYGRWILFPSGGDGHFSLVLRREGDVWRILHDHSS